MGRPASSLGGRPGTAARAAPPRLKRKELGEVEPRQDSASSNRQTAGLIQPETGKEEEEDAFVMEEPGGGDVVLSSEEGERADANELDAAEHGGLVRKILETKKELESGLGETGRGGSASRGGAVTVYDEKERERTAKEVARLQTAVQELTKTAHPLGRLVDFMQEDVDSMVKELEQWREEGRKSGEQLQRLLGSQGGGGGDEYRARLTELDDQLSLQREANAALKASILNTNTKLNNLLSNVAR